MLFLQRSQKPLRGLGRGRRGVSVDNLKLFGPLPLEICPWTGQHPPQCPRTPLFSQGILWSSGRLD